MLKFLRKKIKRLLKRTRGRKKPHVFSEKTQHFLPEDASNFLFFQFNSGNAQYFFQQNNMMRVHIADTPHYYVAKHSLSKDVKGIKGAKSKYIEYLKSSWPSHGLNTSQTKLDAKYYNHLKHIDIIAKAGKLDDPVILTQIPGRKGYYVVDGNHRSSITSALGIPVPAKILDFTLAFDHYMRVGRFYGTANKNMPYQSIYLDRQIVRDGRRDDIYSRLGLLPDELLKQSILLDVGCNIGMNAIGAFKSGARKVVGLEVSKKMVNFATRFAVLDECYPAVTFRQFDVDKDLLPDDEKYDVAFMLSIHHHLKRPHMLVDIARKNVVKAVVFEGHPNTNLKDYKDLLNAVQFSKIEKIADLSTSVFDRKPTRPLWILYK